MNKRVVSWRLNSEQLSGFFPAKNTGRDGKENSHAAFDAGADWMTFNLQPSMLGLYAHGLGAVVR